MTRLEEILGEDLPVVLNKNFKVQGHGKIKIQPQSLPKSLEDIIDLDPKVIDTYCLIDSGGYPTLDIEKAYKKTPGDIPYIEIRVGKTGYIPVSMFYVGNQLYTPIRGNTVMVNESGEAIPIQESGLFDFEWPDKRVLEESGLLYIMKDINRPALSKYTLRDIYNAFQEYKDKELVVVNRNLMLSELTEIFTI